jgi:hypothetical protein
MAGSRGWGRGWVRILHVGGWVEGNKRNWIIQRGNSEEVGLKKKSKVEDSKERQRLESK